MSLAISSSFAYGQVGINTSNPQGVFNIDGKSTTATTNPATGIPTVAQLADDFIVTNTGATGIGGMPNASAILDLTSSNKGFVAPRVVLTSTTDSTTISNPTTGLLVYNLGTGPGFSYVGYVFWNGSEWRSLDNSTVVSPAITTLVCSSAALSPSGWTANVAYTGNLKVSYTGGNGGAYQAGNPVTVNGLTFTLRSGRLEFGNGELVFSVTGTPTGTSDMTIPMNNSLIPFLTAAQSCNATIIDQTTADIKSVAIMAFPSNYDGSGYSVPLQTPDGKYRVRVWWDTTSGTTSVRPNIQIYNNSGTSKTLYWNNGTEYGGYVGSAGNASTIPVGVWGGFRESNTWYPASYWGNEGILDASNGGPEYRRYSWIDDSTDSKIEYSAFIMAGAPTSGSSTPNSTKIFIKIEQVTAP